MGVYTFDPKNIVLILGGVTINGWADGEFLTLSRYTDSYNIVSGADGIVSRAKTNDRTGSISAKLAQTSPSNSYMSVLANIDERTGAGVFPVICKDLKGASHYFSGTGWVKKPADVSYSKGEITDREWIIDLAVLEYYTGGNIAN